MKLFAQGKMRLGKIWAQGGAGVKQLFGKAVRGGLQFYRKRRLLVLVVSFLFLLVVGWVSAFQPWFQRKTVPITVAEAEGEPVNPLTEMVTELQKELAELRELIPAVPMVPGKTDGEKEFWSLKLIPPVRGEVVRRNDWEKRYTEWRYHPGIDLTVPAGTEVLACAAGVVQEIKADPGLGRVVLLDHGQGWQSLYGHLSAVQVAPGQKVEAGMVLGHASVSTCGPEPGIHFELRHQNRPVDPLTMLGISDE
ncbi:MAG: M23 family metallopeptidase [Firmicutes bacterium]|nr:M23 family metallopeptidase [Bacillota bacterium]